MNPRYPFPTYSNAVKKKLFDWFLVHNFCPLLLTKRLLTQDSHSFVQTAHSCQKLHSKTSSCAHPPLARLFQSLKKFPRFLLPLIDLCFHSLLSFNTHPHRTYTRPQLLTLLPETSSFYQSLSVTLSLFLFLLIYSIPFHFLLICSFC